MPATPVHRRRARQTAAEWRWVYNDPRWAPLRDPVRGAPVPGRVRPPAVVDHIRPHRGNEQLAFDRANLQAMCKPCHDAKTARETGFLDGGHRLQTTARVTLVCGPPCSGKSPWVREHAEPGDLIVDWDALAVIESW